MTRILCIDDNPAARYVFTRVLRAAGYDVLEGATASEAVELIRREKPDLVLLDVNLPDGNGREVCIRIRDDEEVANTPIVLTSASAIAGGDRIRGLGCGADAYITEPSDSEELLAVIKSLLRMRTAERSLAFANEQLERRVKELETLIDTVPVGIAIARDAECEQMIINPPMAAMLGLGTAGQMSSRSIIGDEGAVAIRTVGGESISPDNLPMQVAAATGSVVRGAEFVVHRRDHSQVQVTGHAAPLRDDAGRVNGVVGAFVDVTESRRQEAWRRMLAESSMLVADTLVIERTLERVAEIAVRHMADWCVVDLLRDGKLERLAVAHRDPARKEAAARVRDEFQPNEGRSAIVYAALHTMRPQLVHDATALRPPRRDDGVDALLDELGLKSTISVPLVARGRCLGVLSMINARSHYDEHDVSSATLLAERAAMAVDNAILFAAAGEANRAKDDFLALVSHELRTPLTAISGWVELLQRDLDREVTTQGLGEVAKATISLRRLVEDLLDLSRINSGKLRVESEKVDVSEIANEACDIARAAAAAKSIELHVSAERSAYVLGDAMRLQQIVTNLLNNAVKFTEPGGRVDVAVASHDAEVTLRVSDTGRGIAPEFLPRVFERFAQAEPAGASGLGLGLALVKNLAELHGGRVAVESEGRGKGATFTVALPRAVMPLVM